MIKQLKKLKNCGIFRDFKWTTSLNDFGKYNLVYGLNGSGKSTLSQAISYFSAQVQDETLGAFELEVSEESGASIGPKCYNTKLCNPIYVFNKDFIQKNIETSGKLDEIIYLSEENIGAKNILDAQKSELEKLKAQKTVTAKFYTEKKRIYDKLLPDIAASVKTKCIAIGGIVAQKYQNFDKRGAENFYLGNKDLLQRNDDTEDSRIESLSIALKETPLPIIDNKYSTMNKDFLKDFFKNAKQLIEKSVPKAVVSNYSKEILNWIESGLTIVDTNECPFCNGIITNERFSFLNSLFDVEYKKHQENIDNTISHIERLELEPITIEFDFYHEYTNDIKETANELNAQIVQYNKILAEIKNKLIERRKVNDRRIIYEIANPNELIDKYNKSIEKINLLIEKNNAKTSDFTNKQIETLSQLVTLLLCKYFKEIAYEEKRIEFNAVSLEDKNQEAKIQILEQGIKKTESKIRDVLVAAENFNALLQQFLGRSEISLDYDELLKGYKLIRTETHKKAERLSEGEKTAIAFIYFLTKIRENGNLIENTIVVLDDPISSLDSNNLFNAFSFIIATFENSHQLFVLTHNFTFFSLFKRKFGPDLGHGKNMYIIDNYYISTQDAKLRAARLQMLPKTLQILNSDYAFCYKQIVDRVEETDVVSDLTDYFLLSNSCRKLLESFCSFKLISQKDFTINSVKKLMEIGKQNDEQLSTQDISNAERIFKFVNYYSHGSKFSMSSDIDSIIGETISVAKEVLAIIEKADPIHYAQLNEAIK